MDQPAGRREQVTGTQRDPDQTPAVRDLHGYGLGRGYPGAGYELDHHCRNLPTL